MRPFFKDMETVKDSNNHIGEFLAILAGVCWGIISVFVRKLNLFGMDSFQIMAYRAGFSVLILFVYMLIKDKSLLKISIKDCWIFVGSGILSLTFFSYCYLTNIMYSGAAVSVVMLYTSPIFVMIFSVIFFGEKITKRKCIALIMTFTGCVLVSDVEAVLNGSVSITGILLGLGSGIGYALYSLFAGIALKKGYKSLTITFYTFLFSGFSLLLFVKPSTIAGGISLAHLPWIIGVALVCSAIPYIAYTEGMKRIEVSKAAVIVTVEPLVGTLLGIIAYGEATGFGKIAGIIMILISVVMLS